MASAANSWFEGWAPQGHGPRRALRLEPPHRRDGQKSAADQAPRSNGPVADWQARKLPQTNGRQRPVPIFRDRPSTMVDAFGDGTRKLSKLILRAVCCASPPII